MKHVIICGDSFMSPVLSYPGTHFSQIFCSKMGFHLEAFARSGMSNAGIAIQINSALKRKPDLIIFNTTSFDRIELPVKHNLTYDKDFNFNEGFVTYDVEDLLYTQAHGLSSHSPWANKNPKLWSISINDLLNHTPYDSRLKLTDTHNAMTNLDQIEDYDHKMKIAKEWYKYLYDEINKKTIDSFMMYGVIRKVMDSNIDWLYVHDSGCFSSEPIIIKDKLPQKNWVEQIGHIISSNRSIDFDPGYHTTFKGQELIAECLIEHYNKHF